MECGTSFPLFLVENDVSWNMEFSISLGITGGGYRNEAREAINSWILHVARSICLSVTFTTIIRFVFDTLFSLRS